MKKIIMVAMLLSLIPAYALCDIPGPVAWESLPKHIQSMDIKIEPNLTDCPDDLTGIPFSTVIQWIENTFYKWREYELNDGQVCIVMEKPRKQYLSKDEALVLLKGSSLWRRPQSTPSGTAIDKTDPSLDAIPMKKIKVDEEDPWPENSTRKKTSTPPAHPGSGLSKKKAEMVVGIDERWEISNTKAYPYNTICYLDIEKNGYYYRGTGFLVAPYTVLTCGHNVYDDELNIWSDTIIAIPGQYETYYSVYKPYGEKYSSYLYSNKAYTGGGGYDYDYGALELSSRFTGISTYMPLKFDFDLDNNTTVVNISGYPSEAMGYDRFGQWLGSGSTSTRTTSKQAYYNCDTEGGSSGSPVMIYYSSTDSFYVVAIHTFEHPGVNLNGGTRLTASNQSLIEEWLTFGTDPLTTYYRDYDGDGYGNPNNFDQYSTKPLGYVLNKLDCNDYDNSIHPGATEICGDGVDQDCDGADLPCTSCEIDIEGISITGTKKAGSQVIFTVNAANSCNGTIYYRFSCHSGYGTSAYDGRHWTVMSSNEYQASNQCRYTFSSSGQYIIVVWATPTTTGVDSTKVQVIGVTLNVQ